MAVSDLLPVAVLVVDPGGALGAALESAADTERDRVDLSRVGDPEVALDRITDGGGPDAGERATDDEGAGDADCVLADARATDTAVLDRLEAAAGPRPVLAVTDGRTETVCPAYEAGVDETIPAAPVSEAPGRILDRIVECVRAAPGRHRTTTIDELAAPVTVHDPASGALVDVNRAAADRLGYDREALVAAGVDGLTASDVDAAAPDAPGAIRDALLESTREDPATFEWPVETADGERRVLAVTATRVDDPEEPRVMATARDVTERRQLERSYRELFESVGDGLVVHDPETGEIVDVNERFCRMNGYDRDQLVGETVDLITASEDEYSYDEAGELIDRARREGAQLFEWRNERADGETFPVEVQLNVATIRGEERVMASVRDVTERKRREREFEQIFHGVIDPIAVYDPETLEILDANDAFLEMIGEDDVESVREAGLGEFMVTEEGFTVERGREIHRRVVESGEPETFEWKGKSQDDEHIWLEVKVTPAVIGGDTVTVASHRDVTERKRRRKEFEQIFHGVEDPITIHDPETAELVECNEGFCELVGYSREELLGMGIEGYSPEEEGFSEEAAREFVHEVVESGEPRKTEWVVETADGERRILEVKGTAVEVGGETRYVAIDRDITERRRREREYEQVFNGVNDSIVVHDPDTLELIDANETFCDLVGYDREEVLELGTTGLSVTEEGYTLERAAEVIEEAMETGEVGPLEWVVETADGEHRILEVTATPAEIGGERKHVSMMRDITERRRRQREYEQIFDSVHDTIAVFDPETGEIVDVNRRYHEVWGYDDLETIRELGIEGLSATGEGFTGERGRELIREVAESGESRTVEWLGVTKEGERRWTEATLTAAEIGGKRRVLSIQRDITERRRREREYERIFNAVQDAIILMDPETLDIVEANEAYFDLVGYDDLETIRELGVEGLSATDEGFTVEEGRAIHRRVVESGDPEVVEWKAETAEGDRRWLEIKIAPAVIGGQDVNVTIHRDVTEQRERQRRIAEEREKYSTLVEQSTDGVVVVKDGRYTFVNERFCAVTGYDEEELLSMPFDEVFAPESRDLVRERYEARVAGESPPRQYDVEVETADGERRVFELAVSRITHEGEPATMANFRDVTERRRFERQLKTIAERVDEVIYVASPDLDEVQYLSPSYEELFDQSVERMFEDPDVFLDRIHPEDREWFEDDLERLRRDLTDPERDPQDTYEFQYRVVHGDGDVRWIDVRGYPVFDDAGNVDQYISINRDVTERKERERTVESFQEATTELTTAETAAEACRTAVATATDAFDLPRMAVHLYDEETGELAPTAATEAVGKPADLPTWSATDDTPWEVFVDGTMDSVDVTDAPSLAVGAGESALLVALSGHGLITVWARDDDAITGALETANLLAATLEGALNHIAGERRLESHRERLRAETERAERLERIAELTRRVEAAITGQSDRVGVERAVCERLTDIEPFTAAWVAAPEVGTDRLAARTVVGIPEDHAERALATAPAESSDRREGGPRVRHPAYDAWESGAVSVATDLVGTGPGGDWRETLLREGAGAVCAVPLAYEGITHGVLTVVAEDPGAFDDRERETLDQLGTSIGYAISAVERRRALESDATVELEFRGDGRGLPFERLAAATDCQVRHGRTIRRRDGSIRVVYTVFGDLPGDLEAVADEALPGDVAVGSRREGEAVVERTGTDWFGEVVSEYGGVLRQGRASPEETTLVVELPTETDTRRFVERLEERIPGVELVAQRQHQASESTPSEVGAKLEARLTDRQHEAIETALEMGYFEWPREASGQEVADRMDITQPTLNKHLRVAEREAIELVVG